MQKYSLSTIEQKAHEKTALQAEIGWPEELKRPMLCIPGGVSAAQGGMLLEKILPGLLSLSVELLILGKGSKEYGSFCTGLEKEHPHRIRIVPNTKEAQHKMYAACDMAIFFHEPSKTEICECLRNGVVPITPKTSLLKDYNPIQESGNAFLYEDSDDKPWHCFAALVRATETHCFPFDWRSIQKECMKSIE